MPVGPGIFILLIALSYLEFSWKVTFTERRSDQTLVSHQTVPFHVILILYIFYEQLALLPPLQTVNTEDVKSFIQSSTVSLDKLFVHVSCYLHVFLRKWQARLGGTRL